MEGLDDYVDAARGAKSPREALFFIESAEMLELQHDQARKELGAAGLQLQLTGQVSPRARTELQSRGFAVKEGVASGSPYER